jgi:hypothetical protein
MVYSSVYRTSHKNLLEKHVTNIFTRRFKLDLKSSTCPSVATQNPHCVLYSSACTDICLWKHPAYSSFTVGFRPSHFVNVGHHRLVVWQCLDCYSLRVLGKHLDCAPAGWCGASTQLGSNIHMSLSRPPACHWSIWLNAQFRIPLGQALSPPFKS